MSTHSRPTTMGTSLRFLTLFGVVRVHALAFPGPQPTNPLALPREDFAWSPLPTPGPDGALFRRQAGLPDTYLVAPDNTCGFISASARAPFACEENFQCAFLPPSADNRGVAACCRGNSCSYRTACVPKGADCDKDCQADPHVLKCTGATGFCHTVSFVGDGMLGFVCSSKKATGIIRAFTTHSGDRTREFSTVKPTSSSTKKTSSTSSKSSTSKSSTTSSSSSSSSAESSASSDTAASTTTPDGQRGPASSPTNTAAAGSSTESSSVAAAPSTTSAGPIVGGVLGGLALVAMVAFGAIYLRQRAKKNASPDFPPAPPFISQQPTLPMSQPSAPSYPQNTSYPQNAASSNMSGYPASTDMYAVPAAAGAGAAAGAAAAATMSHYHNEPHHHQQPSTAYPTAHGASYSISQSQNPYPDPSPMSTPAGSPRPQYQHQPHAPPPIQQPSYYQVRDTWASSVPGGPVDVPDRRDNSTPVSTYNGTTPVEPASALGPMPGESQAPQQHSSMGSGSNSSGVPLILQPGMGYRPYRPAGSPPPPTVSSISAESNSGDPRTDESGNGPQPAAAGAAVRAVSASPGPQAQQDRTASAGNQQQQQLQQQQQQQQQQASGSTSEPVELP